MTSHADLAARLDAAIGDAAPDPDPDRVAALVAAGRRARARRRAGLGAACAVVLLAGGGVALAAAGSDRAATDPGVATDPAAPGTRGEGALVDDELVALTLDGRLVVRDGVEVLQRVDNPLGSAPPASSLGLAVREGGTTYWYLLDTDGTSGAGSSHEVARRSFPTLRSWLADRVALESGRPTLALVRMAPDGRLTPRDGVTIVRQRTGVRLGNDFADPGTPTAVAEVRWRGRTWFVAARRFPGYAPEYFPSAASVSGPTLRDFLAAARQRFSEKGAGLR
jgi:hypothetical protein